MTAGLDEPTVRSSGRVDSGASALSVTIVAVMGAPHLGAGRARPTTKRYHDGPTERHGVAS